MHAHAFPLLCALLIPTFTAHAQVGDNSPADAQIITPAHPIWLLEQPYADDPMLIARTSGDSAYGDYKVKAALQIECHPQSAAAYLALQIAPAPLGFDSDPFEGKDANADGPLTVTVGKRNAIELSVNGVWTHAGAFQLGTIFALSTPFARDELAYWASDAARGQPVVLSLAPAQAGGQRLNATFTLPNNNNGLKKVVGPCLSTTAHP